MRTRTEEFLCCFSCHRKQVVAAGRICIVCRYRVGSGQGGGVLKVISRGLRRPAYWAGGPQGKGVVQPKHKVVISRCRPVDGTSERLLAGRSPKPGGSQDGASRSPKASPGLVIRRKEIMDPWG